MNKPSKCKNCQWYGKPYWSIINPCDNCPKENDYKTIVQIDGVPVIKETLTEEEIKKGMTDKSIFELTIEQKDKEIERQSKMLINRDKEFLKLNDEIERLNNIIDELEKWVKENNVNNRDIYGYEMEDKVIYLEDFLDKLKELKEGK